MLARLGAPGLDVHVVLNNNAEDQAPRNGRTLMRMMDALGGRVVAPTAASTGDLFEQAA